LEPSPLLSLFLATTCQAVVLAGWGLGHLPLSAFRNHSAVGTATLGLV